MLTVVFVLLTVIVLRHFSQYLVFYDDFEDDAFRSVFIQGITRAHNAHISDQTIRDHFQYAKQKYASKYQICKISNMQKYAKLKQKISFVYDGRFNFLILLGKFILE